jgi:hypothetical protein
MAEHASANDGSFQRSDFRHTAAKKQGDGSPAQNQALIRDFPAPARQQTNIFVYYGTSY